MVIIKITFESALKWQNKLDVPLFQLSTLTAGLPWETPSFWTETS